MKKTFILACLPLFLSVFARADEGMWLPSLISERIGDMQAKGFRLTAEDIYSINQASLKDAVVLFGRGCTGELISPEGLLITNHHCGYSQIQKHSSVEHDYLKDGFWAMTRNEELPNKGLTVSFLDRMEDVTEAVLDGYSEDMTESQRDSVVKANSARLIEQAVAGQSGMKASVEALFYGNQYFMFVYRVYEDIRLVGAPPSSIGKFGGETDNWMWPRHTGDFSIFRIYAGKDNAPAAYSPDNVPYTPKKYFKISLGGVNEGDFTFIYGNPGKTQEYICSADVRYTAEISDPLKIGLRTLRLNVFNKYMSQDQAVRIQYSAKKASVANSWKKWQGESKGIQKNDVVRKKKDFEADFCMWAKGSEYEGLVEELDSLCSLLLPYRFAADLYTESAYALELPKFAAAFAKAIGDEKAKETVMADFYKDYYLPIDRECFIAVMEEFARQNDGTLCPEYFKESLAEYGTVENWADAIYSNSIFADREKVAALGPDDIAAIEADPAYVFSTEFRKWYNADVFPRRKALNDRLNLKYRDYMRGMMEYQDGRNFYPDANLTLRVAYGNVAGYCPSDAVYYKHYSTLTGIMEKDNPEIFDYDIPQRLRDIYASRDYGRWDVDGEIPVCFIATNHTTGGNSGSPVIDADGNLIGINFDRVWEGTMSDIVFDPDLCRNIALDIRYALFVIDKVAGAGHLLDEMSFVE